MICYCDHEEQLLPVSALTSYMAVHLVHELESCVRGHHTYKEVWTPVTGEVLTCARETVNLHDHFAVKVLRAGVIVGHLPKKISTICSLFLSKGGTISCQVSGNRRYSSDLIQGGLEVPCILKLEGGECLMLKTKKLLAFSENSNLAVTNPNKKRRHRC